MRVGVIACVLLAVLANSEIVTMILLLAGLLAFGCKCWEAHERRWD